MTENINAYEEKLAKIVASSRRIEITEKENSRMIAELNKGMEEFVFKQKVIEKESMLELTGLVLNA